MAIKQIMELEDRDLKSTFRYKNADYSQAPVIDYLYIKKYAFKGNPPKKIEVVIQKSTS